MFIFELGENFFYLFLDVNIVQDSSFGSFLDDAMFNCV